MAPSFISSALLASAHQAQQIPVSFPRVTTPDTFIREPLQTAIAIIDANPKLAESYTFLPSGHDYRPLLDLPTPDLMSVDINQFIQRGSFYISINIILTLSTLVLLAGAGSEAPIDLWALYAFIESPIGQTITVLFELSCTVISGMALIQSIHYGNLIKCMHTKKSEIGAGEHLQRYKVPPHALLAIAAGIAASTQVKVPEVLQASPPRELSESFMATAFLELRRAATHQDTGMRNEALRTLRGYYLRQHNEQAATILRSVGDQKISQTKYDRTIIARAKRNPRHTREILIYCRENPKWCQAFINHYIQDDWYNIKRRARLEHQLSILAVNVMAEKGSGTKQAEALTLLRHGDVSRRPIGRAILNLC